MRLAGWLRGEVNRRREVLPAARAESEERIGPIEREARRAAYSALGDEAASAELRLRITASPKALSAAALRLEERRRDYIGDRSYRLLAAAAAGTGVPPVPPEREGLFAAEEAIGRMPIEQAFRRLTEAEPRLLELDEHARYFPAEAGVEGGLPRIVREPLSGLVGGGAKGESELLRSALAASIAYQYLEFLAGDGRSGPGSTPYFDHPRKRHVAAVARRRGHRARLWRA